MIRNKRLFILILLLAITIAIALFIKVNAYILPVKVNTKNISEIGIFSADLEYSKILTKQDDAAAIKKIAALFNKSKKHPDQGVGTTHPIFVRIKNSNKIDIEFLCGVGNFITVARNGRQYNYINDELNEYIENLID